MRRIAHIVNPFSAEKSSEQYIAQKTTFETMRLAREFSRGQVDVDLFSVFYPDDRSFSPEGFQPVPELDRSVLDVASFQEKRRLPLLVDILDRLYEASDAEYFIYTNVDIALMPHFYMAVDRFIDAGHDSFVINRRTIPEHFQKIDEIPQMYSELGKPHEGHDCFVFRRELHKKNIYGNTCIGMPFINRVLIFNFECHAKNFNVFKRKHLTFHIGNYTEWKSNIYLDYAAHNKMEFVKVLTELEKEHGAFDKNGPLAVYLIDDIIDGEPMNAASKNESNKTRSRVSTRISQIIKPPVKFIVNTLFGTGKE